MGNQNPTSMPNLYNNNYNSPVIFDDFNTNTNIQESFSRLSTQTQAPTTLMQDSQVFIHDDFSSLPKLPMINNNSGLSTLSGNSSNSNRSGISSDTLSINSRKRPYSGISVTNDEIVEECSNPPNKKGRTNSGSVKKNRKTPMKKGKAKPKGKTKSEESQIDISKLEIIKFGIGCMF